MGSFSGQFSRTLPGPPWGQENGIGVAWVHGVSSLMRSARGFSLAWSRRVRDRGLLPRARDADSFCLSLTALSRAGLSVHIEEGREPVVDLLHDRCAGLDVSKKDV